MRPSIFRACTLRSILLSHNTQKLYPELNSVLEFLPSSDPADLKSRLKPFMRNGVLETIDLPAAELEELKCEDCMYM